ncbi:MAG TPA: hypothetical protein VIV12_13665, partial [Streptosporangiaceae bacterium]
MLRLGPWSRPALACLEVEDDPRERAGSQPFVNADFSAVYEVKIRAGAPALKPAYGEEVMPKASSDGGENACVPGAWSSPADRMVA